MLKIVSLEIIDLIAYSRGIQFVLKEPLEDGKTKISFYSFDTDTKDIAKVTKNAYLMTKFGTAYSAVCDKLGDYIACDSVRLRDGKTFVIYASGEIGVFAEDGSLLYTGDLLYKDSPARDAAADGVYIWSVVPSDDLIVRYSVAQNRVVMRIGGDRSDTFARPVAIEEYDGKLYICNQKSCTVKTVDLSDYTVSEYKIFDEPVHKYLRVGENEFVILDSGVYML